MVKRYAPWFLETYEFLSTGVYRVDAACKIYMHIFRGVYADLDTECVLPYDSMFDTYNVFTLVYKVAESPIPTTKGDKEKDKALIKEKATKPNQHPSPHLSAESKRERKVFLGRIGTDNKFQGLIPNV